MSGANPGIKSSRNMLLVASAGHGSFQTLLKLATIIIKISLQEHMALAIGCCCIKCKVN